MKDDEDYIEVSELTEFNSVKFLKSKSGTGETLLVKSVRVSFLLNNLLVGRWGFVSIS